MCSSDLEKERHIAESIGYFDVDESILMQQVGVDSQPQVYCHNH